MVSAPPLLASNFRYGRTRPCTSPIDGCMDARAGMSDIAINHVLWRTSNRAFENGQAIADWLESIG